MKTIFSMRIDRELLAEIRDEAVRQNRTTSNLIETILRARTKPRRPANRGKNG